MVPVDFEYCELGLNGRDLVTKEKYHCKFTIV